MHKNQNQKLECKTTVFMWMMLFPGRKHPNRPHCPKLTSHKHLDTEQQTL